VEVRYAYASFDRTFTGPQYPNHPGRCPVRLRTPFSTRFHLQGARVISSTLAQGTESQTQAFLPILSEACKQSSQGGWGTDYCDGLGALCSLDPEPDSVGSFSGSSGSNTTPIQYSVRTQMVPSGQDCFQSNAAHQVRSLRASLTGGGHLAAVSCSGLQL